MDISIFFSCFLVEVNEVFSDCSGTESSHRVTLVYLIFLLNFFVFVEAHLETYNFGFECNAEAPNFNYVIEIISQTGTFPHFKTFVQR